MYLESSLTIPDYLTSTESPLSKNCRSADQAPRQPIDDYNMSHGFNNSTQNNSVKIVLYIPLKPLKIRIPHRFGIPQQQAFSPITVKVYVPRWGFPSVLHQQFRVCVFADIICLHI